MDNPTPENLSRFYTAQRLSWTSVRVFRISRRIIFLKTQDVWKTQTAGWEGSPWCTPYRVEKNQQTVMKDIFTKSGLFSFSRVPVSSATKKVKFSSLCELLFCRNSSCQHGWQTFTKWLFQDFSVPNAQIIDQFKIRECQLFSLCRKTGHQRNELAKYDYCWGAQKYHYFGCKGHEPIDDASFQSTLDVKRQYTIGEMA